MQIPLATVERPSRNEDQVSYVTIDNFAATRTVIEHLISIGRKRIALVAGAVDNMDAQDRLEAFRQVHGVKPGCPQT